jgi:hypothetical protein
MEEDQEQEHLEHQYHLLEDAYEEKHRGRKIYNGEVNLQFVSLALFFIGRPLLL